MPITHAFVNPKADGTDTTITRPSDWNAAHTIAAATITSAMLSLTTVDATLSADVAITTGNTFVDGPSASFVSGIWLIHYKVMFEVTVVTVQNYEFTARLWDGTTVYDEAQSDAQGNNSTNENTWSWAVNGFAIVTLGSTTTLKVSGASTRANASSMLRDVTANGAASHTATRLIGVRIG